MQDTTNTLIIIAIIAWVLQIILGWWQISRFNNAFELLCQQGKVGVGRTTGRFRPKVLIAVAFDENQRVVGTIIMKGLTVFSRPQNIAALQGLLLSEIDPMMIFPNDKYCREALCEAIRLQ